MAIIGENVKYINNRLRFLMAILGIVIVAGIAVYIKSTPVFSGGEVPNPITLHALHYSGVQINDRPNLHYSVKDPGYISGTVIYPETNSIPNDMYVCAETKNNAHHYCTDNFSPNKDGSADFNFAVPGGTYFVYSAVGSKKYRAYYDNYIICGMKDGCSVSPAISIAVEPGKSTSGVSPNDWYQSY